MAGWRGKALVIAVLAAALLAGTAAAGHFLFDSDSIKAIARDRVHAATGRTLRLQSLSVRLLPVPALRAGGVSLSNPDWATERQMLEAGQVDVRLSWRALLSGRLAPGAILIDSGRIHLERRADGRRSWTLEGAGEGSSSLDWRALTSVRADSIHVQYRDAGATRQWQLGGLSASARPGWRDVHLDAAVLHRDQRMTLQADLADLSRAGQAGASTPGRVALRWQSAALTLAGQLPLSATGSEDAAADLVLEAQSAAAMLAFLDLDQAPGRLAPPASLALRARLTGSGQSMTARVTQFRLGQTEASGELSLRRVDARLKLEGRVDVPALDWAILAREAGRPPPAAIPENEVFRRDPLPWAALSALDGVDSLLSLHVGRLRLRSGIVLGEVRAQWRGRDSRGDMSPLSMNLLGGSARGSLALDGAKHAAELRLDASGVMLERWFNERGRKVPVSGGPMRITASLNGRGDTMRELAGGASGLITARGGDTVIRSQKAGDAESLLTGMFPLFSERDAGQLRLQCFAARFALRQGRAGEALVGARSDASQLLTSGVVDLKRQSLDLRGRVRAREGISLGVALLSGDVSITGPLTKPKMALDPSSPGALARLGAAVITGGLSIVATAAWDAANPAGNPCQAVFEARGGDR